MNKNLSTKQLNTLATESLPDDVVVSVKNVSKKFCRNLRRSMAYGIGDLAKNLAGFQPDSTNLKKDEFWALQDINFELRRGEVLGLIGVNGSGKTTLLRLLSGIFPPDKGEIAIKGRVGALIALGAGFHPHMTGRENVYLNGSILGLNRSEIDKQFDSIVDFSEIGEFIDAPVSTYSSGMHVRLGFSIAMAIHPDVLFIDEVLAVGDMGFKMKCLNAMSRLLNQAAVVFVSHSMLHVSQISTKIIVLDQGEISLYSKDVYAGIDYYISQFQMPKGKINRYGKTNIEELRISNGKEMAHGNTILNADFVDDLIIEMIVDLEASVKNIGINIVLKDREFRSVAQCSSNFCGLVLSGDIKKKKIEVRIPQLRLTTGVYSIIITINDLQKKEVMLRYDHAAYVQFSLAYTCGSTFLLDGEWVQYDVE